MQQAEENTTVTDTERHTELPATGSSGRSMLASVCCLTRNAHTQDGKRNVEGMYELEDESSPRSPFARAVHAVGNSRENEV